MAKGNATGVGGGSSPAWGKKSSNSALGGPMGESRIENGTVGSREGMAYRYGGDKNDGTLFKGKSASSPNREMNSGSGEHKSSHAGVAGKFGPESGSLGSRENMPKYGRETNSGKLVGKGAGATKASSESIVRGPKTAGTSDVVRGTNDDRASVARAKIGRGRK